ncbi:MAG: hypothetical protein HY716_16040 [Planctomycetes bacterium]|nr:hypothetical protein [Planctomycetota bacterium]
MRRLRPAALLFLASCEAGAGIETSRAFEEANQAFQEAKTPDGYLRAAAKYESLLEDGFINGAVLYNLGNAYVRAGKRGHAMAAYRRALRYRPRDPYLQANLESVRASLNLPIRESRSLLDHVFFWQRWISYPEKARAFAAAATVTFLLALAALIFVRRRTLVRAGMWIGVAVTALAGVSLALDYHEIERTRHGVVAAPDVIARKGNAESFDPAFTEPLGEGTEFTVLEERAGWIHLRLPNGLTGWVPKEKAVTY